MRPLSLPSRRRAIWPLLAGLLLITLAGIVSAAPETRIATILIEGLKGVDREQFLADIDLHEGDIFSTELIRDVERRGRLLPYLSRFDLRSQLQRSHAHLRLMVRMEKKLLIAPILVVGDDGDLAGGFKVESRSLLGGRERWDLQAVTGGQTVLRLRIGDFRPWLAWLPGLNLDCGLEDWDQPFWLPEQNVEETRVWLLGGPSFRLPRGGRLLLLGGVEELKTNPAVGYSLAGDDRHPLFRLSLRQSLAAGLELRANSELRTPSERRGFARGDISLVSSRHAGRWLLESQVSGGQVNTRAPVTTLYFMDSWRYLHAFDLGSLPARQFAFLRLRADRPVFHMPLRTRRNGPEEDLVLSGFLLFEATAFRLHRDHDWDQALDYGFGLSAEIPVRPPIRISLGFLWNDQDDSRQVFMLENR